MSIVREIRQNAYRFQDLPAVVEADRQWTYAAFYERIDRLSNVLLNLGARKGDRLLCWLPNVREALEAELACLQIGMVWVTLNAGLTWPEVEGVLRATEPVTLVTGPSLLQQIVPSDESVDELLARTHLLVQGGDRQDHIRFQSSSAYEIALAEASRKTPSVEVSESDIARLRYTSGTTGAAKAAVLPHRVYMGSLTNLREWLHPLDTTDRVLHAAPLTHASAALAYPILAAGGANVILSSFNAEHVLDAIDRYRITTMFAVPTMLQRLVAAVGFGDRDLSSIKTISYGGAPMPVDRLMPLLDRLGPVFMQIYGLTEALHPVTCLPRSDHYKGNPKLGSAGRLTPTCAIKIVDDAGVEVEPGTVGEFFIKGPITFDGYWRDPSETEKTLVDGWVASGDLGYCDADGYYWIVDRKKNVIISGGFNVYATEVESHLITHPGIAEASVIGLPDADWGEAVHAVVALKDGQRVLESDLIAWCRQRLAGYKTPKGITFIQEPLPRNAAGKVERAKVAAMVRMTNPTRR